MKYSNCLWPIVLLFIMLGCGTDKVADNRNAELVRQLNPGDQFIKDIDARPLYASEYQRRLERHLELDSLENGFDSVQIRIYAGKLGREYMLILSCRNTKWMGRLIDIEVVDDGKWATEDSIKGRGRSVRPKSGWDSFITGLFDLGVLTISGWSEDPNYMDGWVMVIEIATKKVYRFSMHINPDSENSSKQKSVMSILRLIEAEFRLKPIFDKNVKRNETKELVFPYSPPERRD